MFLTDAFPGAKSSPASLIQSLGASGKVTPDKIINAEIVVNNGIDRCGLSPNTVHCPPGWSPTPVRTYDSNRKEGYYCFKNAGLSFGKVDLCTAEGGHRIEFRADGVHRDLIKLLKGNYCIFTIQVNFRIYNT